MLDRKRILNDPDGVKTGIVKKGADAGLIDKVLELDEERRSLADRETKVNAERKTVAKSIGALMKEGKQDEAGEAKARAAERKAEIGEISKAQQKNDAALEEIMLSIPNVPHKSVPVGEDEDDNVFLRFGKAEEKPTLDFEPKPHWELGESLGILDLPAGARIAGSGFPVFKGLGARLVRALMSYMLDMHTKQHGHTEIWGPCVVNTDSMTGTGQLPKFVEDMYQLGKTDAETGDWSGDGLWLAPTAEVPVTNMLRGVNLVEDDLPIRYVAYTPNFRREAGAAGKDTRGIIRIHQFDKVELVHFTTPEKSYEHLEEITKCAEAVLDELGLHYRVRLLCTGDMTFAGVKTCDIEVWAPGVGKYLEVSSITNFEDFQARRAGIRFRGKDGKMHFAHTLNGSGVAFPRLIIALLETYQQEDGSVIIPEALVEYFGMEKIEAADKIKRESIKQQKLAKLKQLDIELDKLDFDSYSNTITKSKKHIEEINKQRFFGTRANDNLVKLGKPTEINVFHEKSQKHIHNKASEYYLGLIHDKKGNGEINSPARTLDSYLQVICAYREEFEISTYGTLAKQLYRNKNLINDFIKPCRWTHRSRLWLNKMNINYPSDDKSFQLCYLLRNAIAHGNNSMVKIYGGDIKIGFQPSRNRNVIENSYDVIDTNVFFLVTEFWIECIEYLRDEIKNVHGINV
jgi:seryl-tRNA synthetase